MPNNQAAAYPAGPPYHRVAEESPAEPDCLAEHPRRQAEREAAARPAVEPKPSQVRSPARHPQVLRGPERTRARH
ncbi:hypothetical protein GCM10027360_15010 [Amycolatopsis echigonensis]